MRDFFNLKYHGTTYRNEIMAGLSMFVSVAYILVVNPEVLSQCGMDYYGVFMATVITSAISTIAMAVYAKMPFVVAPALSINAVFVWMTMHYLGGNYQIALMATYLSGVLFIVLMMTGLFRKIDRCVPDCVRYGVLVGIGLSLIRTGIEKVGIFKNFWRLETLIVAVALVLIFWLEYKKVKGAIFYVLILTMLVGYPLVALREGGDFWLHLKQLIISEDVFNDFTWNGEVFFAECFHMPSFQVFVDNPGLFGRMLLTVLTFSILHFADAIGTTSSLFAMMTDRGAMLPAEYKRSAMYVNGIAEITSGLLGTSSATSYAESMVGIAEGARTGVAGLTVGILFLISGFVIPRTSNIADFVTAPAIIAAGLISCRILRNLKNARWIDWAVTIAAGLYIGFTFQVALGFIGGMILYYGLTGCTSLFNRNARKPS